MDSKAEVEAEGAHDHDHDHGDKDDKHADHEDGHGHDDHAGHTAFHVTYAIDCAVPANLTSITFDYFKTFAGAEALNVSVVTDKAQNKFEVTRKACARSSPAQYERRRVATCSGAAGRSREARPPS